MVNDGKVLAEGTDYTVEVKAGKEVVESAVDADTYTVTVKPVTFKWEGGDDGVFELTVQARDLNRLVANVDKMSKDPEDSGQIANDAKFFVPYTGEAVSLPGVKYEVQGEDGKYTYAELDPSLYNVVSLKKGTKAVSEAVETGDYEVRIALTDAAKQNYNLVKDTFIFTVEKMGHFTDVASDVWYAVSVERAYDEGYINGISGTNFFAPEAQISRADVACILFNMVGGKLGSDDFQLNEDGYVTGFSDVDGHAYYAKAIAWAHASGVVNGSNGEFRPTDKVTREEFAAMLANYVALKGDDVEGASDEALAKLLDASDVSAWTKQSVAWAVESGVMGNGGYIGAKSSVTRAEVAAMAVNYQPENLTGLVHNENGQMVAPTNKA